MLSYQTIDKLKEANFPNETNTSNFDWYLYREPNLSQLVAACGGDFIKLVAQHHSKEEAELIKKIFKDKCECNWVAYSYTYVVFGDTPEEAVANLWLKLSKPK